MSNGNTGAGNSEPMVEVELATGKKVKVPQSLAADIAELNKGNMRQADFTKKTTEVAQAREQLARERSQYAEAMANYNLLQKNPATKVLLDRMAADPTFNPLSAFANRQSVPAQTDTYGDTQYQPASSQPAIPPDYDMVKQAVANLSELMAKQAFNSTMMNARTVLEMRYPAEKYPFVNRTEVEQHIASNPALQVMEPDKAVKTAVLALYSDNLEEQIRTQATAQAKEAYTAQLAELERQRSANMLSPSHITASDGTPLPKTDAEWKALQDRDPAKARELINKLQEFRLKAKAANENRQAEFLAV